MNQIKIGKFIKQKRKEKKITQSDLAEKLNVTDRAISKWENGNCMPDSGIIPKLCEILEITINDLFSGEIIDDKNYNKSAEQNMLDITKQKENTDKKLLYIEILVGLLCLTAFIPLIIFVSYVPMKESLKVILILIGLFPLLLATPFMLKIEQTAGYYECKLCKNKYIPTYKSVFFAMHVNRTRYLKCPKCNQYSWNKKIISKGEKND